MKRWYIPKSEKVSAAIQSFSLSESLVFYFFFFLFALSTLFLLLKVNNAFMVEVPSAGGTLEEGVIGYPRYINPILSFTDSGRALSQLIYSGLMKKTPGGNLVPDLAESYSVSPDGLTYDFILKKNITFQDGIPVTTDDIQFTILKTQDLSIKSPKEANWQGVTIEIVSPTEIKFSLKKPYGPFLQNTTLGILPKHLWAEASNVDSFTLSALNREPIGSGPYMLKSIKTNSSGLPRYYHLVPFKNYASGHPYINDIIVRFYSDQNQLLSAFNSNEVKNLSSISPDQATFINSRNTIIATSTLPRVFGIFFNQSENPVLLHKEIRQALNVAVDRKKIVKEVLNGYGEPTTEAIPPNLIKPLSATDSGEVSNSADILNLSEADRVAATIKILTNVGWSRGADGIMQKTSNKKSERLSLTISTADAPDLVNTANLVKKMWEAIGAEVKVKIFQSTALNQEVIQSRKYEALLFGEVIPPGLDIYSFWASAERKEPGLNIALYTNSKVDKLLESARGSTDTQLAISNYQKVESEIDNDVPAIFLYTPDFIYVLPKNLNGVNLENINNATERFVGIENWYLEKERVWRIFANN